MDLNLLLSDSFKSNQSVNVPSLEFEQEENQTTFDFSQRNISNIPNSLLMKFPNLQYLYLEGNKLKELSNDFFPTLRQLKWLDVRNNGLKTLPTSIVGHSSLQVLLLEHNEIEKLPVEIGSINCLRGLQLAHNPTVYPPVAIVNLGAKATIDFLQKEWQQLQSPKHIKLISESLSPKNKSCKVTRQQNVGASHSAGQLKAGSHEPCKPHRRVSKLSAPNLNQCIRVWPFPQQLRSKQFSSHQSLQLQHSNQTVYERKTSFNSQDLKRIPSQEKTIKKINDGIQPKLIRDIWIEKIRQVLLTQEAILQQRRSADALKQWQDETKLLQQTPLKRDSQVEINFPYDTDPDHLKMLTRTDLASDNRARRHSSAVQNKHEESVNAKIISIMAALQELQAKESQVPSTPRTEQKALTQEIKKIKEIQRCLNALKLKNFGQLSVSDHTQN